MDPPEFNYSMYLLLQHCRWHPIQHNNTELLIQTDMIWLVESGQSMHVVADLSVSETSNNSLKLKTLTQSTTQADTSILA